MESTHFTPRGRGWLRRGVWVVQAPVSSGRRGRSGPAGPTPGWPGPPCHARTSAST